MAILDQTFLETIATGARLVDLTDDDGDDTADAAPIAAAIAAAHARLNGAARKAGHTLPLDESQVSADAKLLIGWYALGFLGKRRPEYRDAQGRAPYHVELAEAEAFLKRLASGEEVLYPLAEDDGGTSEPSDAGTSCITNASRGWMRR